MACVVFFPHTSVDGITAGLTARAPRVSSSSPGSSPGPSHALARVCTCCPQTFAQHYLDASALAPVPNRKLSRRLPTRCQALPQRRRSRGALLHGEVMAL